MTASIVTQVRIIYVPSGGGKTQRAAADENTNEKIKADKTQEAQLSKPELIEDLSQKLQKLSKSEVTALLNNQKPLHKADRDTEDKFSEEKIREMLANLTRSQLAKIQENVKQYEEDLTKVKATSEPTSSPPIVRHGSTDAIGVKPLVDIDKVKPLDYEDGLRGLKFNQLRIQKAKSKQSAEKTQSIARVIQPDKVVESVVNLFVDAVLKIFQKSSEVESRSVSSFI